MLFEAADSRIALVPQKWDLKTSVFMILIFLDIFKGEKFFKKLSILEIDW